MQLGSPGGTTAAAAGRARRARARRAPPPSPRCSPPCRAALDVGLGEHEDRPSAEERAYFVALGGGEVEATAPRGPARDARAGAGRRRRSRTGPSAQASASPAVLTPRAAAAPAELLDPVVDRGRPRGGGTARAASSSASPPAAASPRRYFPVSQPPASGLNAWYSMPCSAQSGITSASSPRSSSEYEFWTSDGRPEHEPSRGRRRRRCSRPTPDRPRSSERLRRSANVSSAGVPGRARA